MRSLRLSLWLTVTACTTDTSSLASSRRSGEADASVASSGAFQGSAAGSGGTTQFEPLPTSGGAPTTPDVPDLEPALETTLTLVHGLVDAGRSWLCRGSADGQWSPRPSAVLEYGGASMLSGEEAAQLVEDGARWLVVTGPDEEPSQDCEELAALSRSGPSEPEDAGAASQRSRELRAIELPSIAAGSLVEERGYLMVLLGCVGASSHSSELQEAVCGVGYAPGRATATAVLAATSRRTRYDALGLQLLHASLAAPSIDVRSIPPEEGDGSVVTLARGVTVGSLVPRSVASGLGADAHADPFDDGALRVTLADRFEPVFEEKWGSARSRSGTPPLRDARTYAVVMLGPHPAIVGDAWWHGPAFAVVDNLPPLEDGGAQ